MGFFGKLLRIKGPPQAWRGEFRGWPGVVAESLGFLSSCVSNWGTHFHLLREVRSPLALPGAPRDSLHRAAGLNRASPRVEAGTSVFLSISDIDLGVPAELKQGSQASSSVEAQNSLVCLVVHGVSVHCQVVFGTCGFFRTMQLRCQCPFVL